MDPQSLNSVQRLPSKEGLLGLAVQQVTIYTHDEVEAFWQLVAGRNGPVLCNGWSVMGQGWRGGVVELPCNNVGERCQRDHDCRREQRAYLSCTAFHLRENIICALNTQLQKTKRRLPPLPSAQTQEIAPVLLLHRFNFSIRLSLLTERRLDFHEIRSVNFEESVTQAR